VFWNNLLFNGEGNGDTQHASCPVVSGSKWGKIHLIIMIISAMALLICESGFEGWSLFFMHFYRIEKLFVLDFKFMQCEFFF